MYLFNYSANTWLQICSRQDLITENTDNYKNYRICENHFESRYITQGNVRKSLFLNAMPTIYESSSPQDKAIPQEVYKNVSEEITILSS